MPLTAAQVAHLKAKWQYFVVEFVAFPAITWSVDSISPTTIVWEPFCLISPRFAYTSGAAVTLDATDSYVRGGTPVDSVAFSKVSGTGTVTDNGDKTCIVSNASGVVKVQAIATYSGQTATAYAYVYGGSQGNVRAIVSRVDGFSGSLSTGEWKADMVLRGDYSAVLSTDGRDVPLLMHVSHYWDGAADTFGGYKRDENTFVLMCREATIHIKSSGEYETILHLETPAYALKRARMINGEARFSTDPAGDFVVTNLTPTDVLYYLFRKVSNYHQYFNVSIWNNASQMSNVHVKPDASLWDYAQDAIGRNFAMCYLDRWGNFNVKPDPRMRYTEFMAIANYVYEAANPLAAAAMLEYELHHKREDEIAYISMQAVLPDLTVYEAISTTGATPGGVAKFTGLMAGDQATVDGWVGQAQYWLNTPYTIDFRLPMGHELNPGDLFTLEAGFAPPIGDSPDPDSVGTNWIVDDINYEFDFSRNFWTRRLSATRLNTGGT